MTVDELLHYLAPEEKELLYMKFLELECTNERLKENTALNYKSYIKTTWVLEIIKNETGCDTIYKVESVEKLNKCIQNVTLSKENKNNNNSSAMKKYKDAIENACKRIIIKNASIVTFQTIFYGSPGCGKSFTVKKLLAVVNRTNIFRTTFHPDSDYYSFVGSYKPRKDNNGSITYGFSPQVFTKAYMQAWEAWGNGLKALDKLFEDENTSIEIEPIFLIIEEINRGNCAQIFGDLFQLLDRDSEGYSEYPIKANEDLISYIKTNCKIPNAYSNDELRLPPNLYIIATMNTSDQSLFPMDSAFKRRWAWKYVPIDYTNSVSGGFKITIGGKDYGWHNFLEKINTRISDVTKSEDKMLGNFFIKSSIDEEEFVNKVMFYLWNDVLKLEYATGNNSFFKYKEKNEIKTFIFSELFGNKTREILNGFMDELEVKSNDGENTPTNNESQETDSLGTLEDQENQ